MNITERLGVLRGLQLEHTVIQEVALQDKGEFCQPDGHILPDLPPFVRVSTVSTPAEGSRIVCEVWLPLEWNGRYVGLGNGGLAGGIPFDSLADKARRGWAVSQTDMGTADGLRRGVHNPEVWKDFGWRATHVMTVLSKQLIEAFYGRPADKCYFQGGSTGGQQSIAEAQRFPEDYDGIIAGVPANNRTHLHTYFLYNHVTLRKRDGRVLFTREEAEIITAASIAYCRSRGEGEEGAPFVFASHLKAEDIEDYLAFLTARHPHFTEEQITALRAVYTGPADGVTGRRIYNGMPMGSEVFGCGILDSQREHLGTDYPFRWVFGLDYDLYDFDFHKDMETLDEHLAADLNANGDLDAFFARGNKLLIYSGSIDACVPYPDAMRYYQRLIARGTGAAEQCRFFVLPGQDHSAGITRSGGAVMNGSIEVPEILEGLRIWCEEGITPEYFEIIAREDEVKKTRRIDAIKVTADEELDCPACDDYYLAK